MIQPFSIVIEKCDKGLSKMTRKLRGCFLPIFFKINIIIIFNFSLKKRPPITKTQCSGYLSCYKSTILKQGSCYLLNSKQFWSIIFFPRPWKTFWKYHFSSYSLYGGHVSNVRCYVEFSPSNNVMKIFVCLAYFGFPRRQNTGHGLEEVLEGLENIPWIMQPHHVGCHLLP